MIRIALVEDEERYRSEFIDYLKRYEKESGQHFRITVFTDGDEIVDNYKSDYDLILMDIAMRFMDGMTAAEEIRKVDPEVVIIFITNTPQFVMKGYTVDALDYVLKPVSYFSFTQRIDRAISRMSKRHARYISVPIKGGVRKLEVSDILYIEVRNHDLLYHTREDSVLSRGTMAEAEEHLGDMQFYRCSKCYLINLEYVDSVESGDVVIAGERISVSRARKKGLLDALNNYLSEVSK
jgi:DNA-binding LytR/AlgR family response regulator